MATLKWSNVTGDETQAGASALKHAGSLFSKAFESFSGAVEGRQKRETKANTESILNQVRNIGTREDLEAQIANLGDLDARKEQAGGNLDTSAISKALFDKRGYLDTQETQQLSKENAAYQLQKSRTADQRAEELRTRQLDTEQFTASINREARNREAMNEAAFAQTIAAEQKRTEGPGQFQLDPAGNVITAPQATLGAREQFATQAEAAGAQEFQTIGDQRKRIDDYADANKLTSGERTAAHQRITEQYDRSVFSPDEQKTIDTAAATINAGRDRDITAVDEAAKLSIANVPFDKPASPKQIAQDKIKFLTNVRKVSGNKTFFGGGDKGGTDLVKELDTMLSVGGEFSHMEPWEVDQFLMGNIDGENNAYFSFDTYADVDRLKDQLRDYDNTRPIGQNSRAIAQQTAITNASIAQKNSIREKAAKTNSSNLALRERAAGKTLPGKNLGVFNPRAPKSVSAGETQLRESVKNTPAFKKSVPKIKTAPKAVEKTLNEYLDRAKNKKPEEPAFKYTKEAKKAMTALRARGEKAKVAREAKSLQDAIDKIALDKQRHERIYGK